MSCIVAVSFPSLTCYPHLMHYNTHYQYVDNLPVGAGVHMQPPSHCASTCTAAPLLARPSVMHALNLTLTMRAAAPTAGLPTCPACGPAQRHMYSTSCTAAPQSAHPPVLHVAQHSVNSIGRQPRPEFSQHDGQQLVLDRLLQHLLAPVVPLRCNLCNVVADKQLTHINQCGLQDTEHERLRDWRPCQSSHLPGASAVPEGISRHDFIGHDQTTLPSHIYILFAP